MYANLLKPGQLWLMPSEALSEQDNNPVPSAAETSELIKGSQEITNWRERVRRILLQLTLLTTFLLTSACGQKGPLYLPEKDQPEKQSETRNP
jgi:predicted small lipoprotein YifL